MKKNKFMKLASGLLVLCLMTTCVIGATLAKYTTASNSQDSARVAKWGVRVTALTNSAFKTEYAKSALDSTVTVRSSDSKKVVAPGTSGKATEIAVTGKPEVSVAVTFAMTDVNDVKLIAGNYTGVDGEVNLTNDYYPVKFTLKQTTTGDGGATTTPVNGGTLADVKKYLEGLNATSTYGPNTDLANKIGSFELTWDWAFDVSADNNVADTILGDAAAATIDGILLEGAEITDAAYVTEVSYNLTITITQID